MAFLVRQSKYRHVFGKQAKKEQCYDALRISRSSWDSKFCAVNTKYVAVITESGNGSAFIVVPMLKYGRQDINAPQVCGHKGPVFDIAWSPFNDQLIASCSDDTSIKIWQIPEDGLAEPMTESLVTLSGHQRRVTNIAWHPTAENILLSGGADLIVIWNLESGEGLAEYTVPEQVYSLSFNIDGSLFAATFKDKYLRVFDSHTLEMKKEAIAHKGSKPPQCAFLKDNKIFTTGFSKMSERQYSLWNAGTPELSAIVTEEIDSSNGVMHITYDPDSSMIYLVGKGDSVVRYYEITDTDVFYLSMYQSNAPQKGGAFLPKKGVNVMQNEIARFYKLHNNGTCEPVSFTVPRKSELFQEDLFPETASDEPSMTAEEFSGGMNKAPKLMPWSVQGVATPAKEKKTGLARQSVNLSHKKPLVDKESKSSNGPGEPAATAPLLPPTQTSNATVKNTEDTSELKKEFEELKKLVNKQERRIESLEQRVKQLEESNHTDEEDEGEIA